LRRWSEETVTRSKLKQVEKDTCGERCSWGKKSVGKDTCGEWGNTLVGNATCHFHATAFVETLFE
jgi:hypothetical protein